GVSGARLRWPNDVLIGQRKICGILMEKFHPDRVVVGIGLNVTNNPAATDASLASIATSLAAELPLPPATDELYEDLLIGLRVLHGRIAEEGFAPLSSEINAHWGGTREVELTTASGPVRGHFVGIDGRGDLIVQREGAPETHSAPYGQYRRVVLSRIRGAPAANPRPTRGGHAASTFYLPL
ncbi:MAG: biotin--[acetyl-CoA-carboxylase] ligase, partial [Chthoniobacterales bacterium]